MNIVESFRNSVKIFRDPDTPWWMRDAIVLWWESYGLPNQFAVMAYAANIERGQA